MESNGVMSFFYKMSDWIMKLAYVNVLWIVFSILGLVVFGLFPATIAMFTVVRKFLSQDKEVFSVYKTFWNTYKKEFLKSNILGLFTMIISYLFYIEINFIVNYNNDFLNLFFYPLIILSFVFYVTILYIFPTYVHYDAKFIQIVKNAFFIMILNPLTTILMILGYLAIFLLNLYLPATVLFFSGSAIAFVTMKSALTAFKKIEQKSNNLIIDG